MSEQVHDIIEPNSIQYLSPSRAALYDQCPRLWAHQYISLAPREDTVFTIFGKIIHELMQHLAVYPVTRTRPEAIRLFGEYWQEYKLTNRKFFVRGTEMVANYFDRDQIFQYEILGTEIQFGIDKDGKGTPMFVDGIPVHGFMDRVDKVDSETIRVVDYKTNIQMFTKDEVENHIQMSIYCLVAMQMYPWAKRIILVLDQPEFGEFASERTPEQLDGTRRYIKTMWNQMLYDKEFIPKQNEYCCYCPIRGECPEYKRALEVMAVAASDDNVPGLYDEREKLSNQKKAIERRIEEIDAAIKGRIAAGGIPVLTVGGYSYSLKSQVRKEYPLDDIRNICNQTNLAGVLDECLKFEKTKFEKHSSVKGNKIVLAMVDNCAKVSYTKPSIVRTEIKEESQCQ